MDAMDIGAAGEDLATEYLVEHGWTIVERNFRCRIGEIDIVVERNVPRGDGEIRLIAFVEVKTRRFRRNAPPSANITATKRTTLVRLAKAFLKANRIRNARCRFDVIAIGWSDTGQHKIHHLPKAFDGYGRPR